MAWFNWQSYNFDAYGLPQESPPPGKLLLYPIEVRIILTLEFSTLYCILQVQQNGSINNLPNFKSFPDYPSSARVFGTKVLSEQR